MSKIIIIGGGRIGRAAAFLLYHSGGYQVTIADADKKALEKSAKIGVNTIALDVNDAEDLASALVNQDRVLSACPYFLNAKIAAAAAKTNTHYFDLTEDLTTTNTIKEIARDAEVSFMPQCGLAPGFISIAAYDLTQEFDELDTVKLRVGALPQYPTNRLKYNLSWSTSGLVNEYCNPCDAIVDGERKNIQPMEGYETLTVDGISYEAFNTSGGLGGLAKKLAGKVKNLDYKTVRYLGHFHIMKTLLFELNFAHKREFFKEILEENLPFSPQDFVLIFIAVKGKIKGRLTERVFTRKIVNRTIGRKNFTAIQLTTAGSVCAVIDLHLQNKLPHKGFINQEMVDFKEFKNNEFTKYYQ